MLGDRRRKMLLANLTKREYVDLRKVSEYLFQKIFFALLWGGDFNHPQFGRWAGDQVVVVADSDITSIKAARFFKQQTSKKEQNFSLFKRPQRNFGLVAPCLMVRSSIGKTVQRAAPHRPARDRTGRRYSHAKTHDIHSATWGTKPNDSVLPKRLLQTLLLLPPRRVGL
jgi:hypothetical protein